MDPLREDFEIGDSPTKASNGIHVGIIPGVEWQMTRTLALDASLLLDYWHVDETDLSPIGQEPASNGFDWHARLGVMWWNDGGPSSRPAAPDAWAVRPSWRWARGEGRGARDQTWRVRVQRVRAERELQSDQPAELEGQSGERLHVRPQRVQDKPVYPPIQRSHFDRSGRCRDGRVEAPPDGPNIG